MTSLTVLSGHWVVVQTTLMIIFLSSSLAKFTDTNASEFSNACYVSDIIGIVEKRVNERRVGTSHYA